MSDCELYERYRPKTFDEVVGQDHIVKLLKKKLEQGALPHTILLCGPKGCGKTTVARIIRKSLDCSKFDFVEQNCANKRGIDAIREIERTMSLAPMKGKCKMWLFDEAHMWTSESQQALLKILEDTPSHVYFILCTTDPQKLLPTIRSRCMEFPVKPMNTGALQTLINRVCKAEGKKLSQEVMDKLVESADNSARNVLVLLDKIFAVDTEDEQLEAINKANAEVQAFQIARMLMDTRTKWADLSKVIQATEGEEPESLRRMILGYAAKVLLNGNSYQTARAYNVISVFGGNWYDTGRAGLIHSCYDVVSGGK